MQDRTIRYILGYDRLTYADRCLWLELASHKLGFIVHRTHLKVHLGLSEDSIKSGLKKLCDLGFVEPPRRKKGQFKPGCQITKRGKYPIGTEGGKTNRGARGGKTTSLIQKENLEERGSESVIDNEDMKAIKIANFEKQSNGNGSIETVGSTPTLSPQYSNASSGSNVCKSKTDCAAFDTPQDFETMPDFDRPFAPADAEHAGPREFAPYQEDADENS